MAKKKKKTKKTGKLCEEGHAKTSWGPEDAVEGNKTSRTDSKARGRCKEGIEGK